MSQDKGPGFSTPGHYGDLEVTDINLNDCTASFRTVSSNGQLGGPVRSVPFSHVYPDSPEDTHEFWKRFIGKLIEALRAEGTVPEEYEGFALNEDEDWNGDPALYVKILIRSGQSPSDIKVVEWNQFTNSIRDRLIDIFRIQRWPYIELGEASEIEHVPSV